MDNTNNIIKFAAIFCSFHNKKLLGYQAQDFSVLIDGHFCKKKEEHKFHNSSKIILIISHYPTKIAVHYLNIHLDIIARDQTLIDRIFVLNNPKLIVNLTMLLTINSSKLSYTNILYIFKLKL